ncbi:MAG: M28 family peptidase [Bacteroidales bacterium]|nr:M28 family peptidase [Bacteroidales bacterium]
MHTRTLLAMAVLLLLTGCGRQQKQPTESLQLPDYAAAQTPTFDADSAFLFTSRQVDLGPRLPGSRSWQQCATYITSNMSRWCDTVVRQEFKATLWDGTTVPGCNIVASINPHLSKRIILAAHWDSRMWADHDPDSKNHHSPVPGANDGASGVAVLMEMARVMSAMPPSIGIDFIFFDVEDQGEPQWAEQYQDDTWCKGSQHWAKRPHTAAYSAIYGVLFDMVGTANPRFTKEEISNRYAPGLTTKLWQVAASLGYGSVFVNTVTSPILDDHLYVNQIAGIPMVDIVQNSKNGSFFPHWHTTTDDMKAVEKESMQTVATVVMKTIYGDYPHVDNQ